MKQELRTFVLATVLWIAGLGAILGGCYAVPQQDPRTTATLDAILEHRRGDMDLARRIVVQYARPAGPTETAALAQRLKDLDALEIAAEDEIKAVRFREAAKPR